VRAHIGAVIVEEFVFDRENSALCIDRSTDMVALVARMIGRGQVFAPILDPFNRTAKLQRGGADQKILGIKFTTDAEPAANVTLVELDGLWSPLQHPCDRVAIPMRDLCSAVQFQHIACLVVARDRSARLDRHAGVPSDGQFQRDDRRRSAEYGVDIAV
jgi:hypothetical protein